MSNADPDRPGLVVVGGGAGAHTCVAAYRAAGGEAPVTIISDDDRPPYFRPALTKELITGDQQSDEIALEADSWYADQQVLVHFPWTGQPPTALATLAIGGVDDTTCIAWTGEIP